MSSESLSHTPNHHYYTLKVVENVHIIHASEKRFATAHKLNVQMSRRAMRLSSFIWAFSHLKPIFQLIFIHLLAIWKFV